MVSPTAQDGLPLHQGHLPFSRRGHHCHVVPHEGHEQQDGPLQIQLGQSAVQDHRLTAADANRAISQAGHRGQEHGRGQVWAEWVDGLSRTVVPIHGPGRA